MIDWKQKNSHGASIVDLPDNVLSFHVDHGLQADAQKMARAASNTAARFKAASHVELRIGWGEAPFPARPHSGEAVESRARNARYQLMFDAMLRRDVQVLATGHHADDQVETVLMRLGAGSSILGLGGMRPLRRFGMALGKGENDFGWFGHEGLQRWIVRPLLEVSKVSGFTEIIITSLNFLPPPPFRTEFWQPYTRIVSTTCLTARIFNPSLPCAMPFAMCSPETNRKAILLNSFVSTSSLRVLLDLTWPPLIRSPHRRFLQF